MGDDYKVHSITVLEKLPNAAEARAMLEKICWQGEKISVRLRVDQKSKAFQDYDYCLGTMLHELVHIVHGPHNAKFYALLDELTAECEELMNRGIGGSGSGFDAPGLKLSTMSHNPTTHFDAKRKAADAAEARKKKQAILGRGRKLGGRPIPAGRSTSELAAEAALRRMQDDQWCPSGAGGEAGAAEARPSAVRPAPAARGQAKRSGTAGAKVADKASSAGSAGKGDSSKRAPGPAGQTWQCSACTLQNGAATNECAACGALRQSAAVPAAGLANWTCGSCTLSNEGACLACQVCGAVRPPPGSFSQASAPPVAAEVRPPRKALRLGRAFCGCGECAANTAESCPGQMLACASCTYINDTAKTGLCCAMCEAELHLLALPTPARATGEVLDLDA
eukprot:TRINITY_DN37751_c0_g1_i1.p1 TRINITY_DN37751_c0_g1~~TRINITY_DN37751_c0_g1_i1.p1  ORF type:complete len:394 (+),score=64.61 TRINITY_DN37751_c0_g1_i1:98-1279(+)